MDNNKQPFWRRRAPISRTSWRRKTIRTTEAVAAPSKTNSSCRGGTNHGEDMAVETVNNPPFTWPTKYKVRDSGFGRRKRKYMVRLDCKVVSVNYSRYGMDARAIVGRRDERRSWTIRHHSVHPLHWDAGTYRDRLKSWYVVWLNLLLLAKQAQEQILPNNVPRL